jgi:dTDP-4-dehydrorhamnose 3,5-epimerase
MYNDPRLGLTWPLRVTEVSVKDSKWKLLDQCQSDLTKKMKVDA